MSVQDAYPFWPMRLIKKQRNAWEDFPHSSRVPTNESRVLRDASLNEIASLGENYFALCNPVTNSANLSKCEFI